VGNSLRELNLEDVEQLDPGAAQDAVPAVVAEFRTFDGLVITVRGVEQGDQSWATFAAQFSAEQAARFAAGAPAAGGSAANGNADAAPAAAPAAAASDVTAEAQRINERVSGWRYRVASYQYDQITRKLADLLKPAA
jgi:hypothetical protein